MADVVGGLLAEVARDVHRLDAGSRREVRHDIARLRLQGKWGARGGQVLHRGHAQEVLHRGAGADGFLPQAQDVVVEVAVRQLEAA